MKKKILTNKSDQILFDDFIGQTEIVESLKTYIAAAKQREDALDHILLYGPPGLGKTTLSNIIATELEKGFLSTSGPVISIPGDLIRYANKSSR